MGKEEPKPISAGSSDSRLQSLKDVDSDEEYGAHVGDGEQVAVMYPFCHDGRDRAAFAGEASIPAWRV
jgi:hypothetical protein